MTRIMYLHIYYLFECTFNLIFIAKIKISQIRFIPNIDNRATKIAILTENELKIKHLIKY